MYKYNWFMCYSFNNDFYKKIVTEISLVTIIITKPLLIIFFSALCLCVVSPILMLAIYIYYTQTEISIDIYTSIYIQLTKNYQNQKTKKNHHKLII
jgi:hypothetical protein